MINFKKLSILTSITFLGIVIIFSCKKVQDYIPAPDTHHFDNSEMTQATFIGQVLKEDGTPLDGAIVTTGTHQITTDADGFFYFYNIRTPRKAALIRVNKVGYFPAYRTVYVIPEQDNPVQIMAMELPNPEIFQSQQGGSIPIPNGGSIDFQANSIVDKTTGIPYTGEVSVFAKWIDPSSDQLYLLVPGDLRGIRQDGTENALKSYGMQGIELYGEQGQPLQLSNTARAKVHFPLPATMQGDAPENIPLWYFDEELGLWKEEGSAGKNGMEYTADVPHFSFWNCDYGGPVVNFQVTLVDQAATPLGGASIALSTTAYGTRYGTTNSQGVSSGSVPVNTTFNMGYIPAGCNWWSSSPSTFIQSFSTTTSNVNLGTVQVAPSTAATTVNGTAVDCQNNPLANAVVKLKIANQVYSTLSGPTGTFSFSLSCLSAPTPALCTAYNSSTNENGSLSITIQQGVTNNIGNVAGCGTLNDFVTWTATNNTNTITYSIIEPSGTFNQWYQSNTSIYGYDGTIHSFFEFDGPQSMAGIHNLVTYSDMNDSLLNSISPAVINLTQYGAVGGKIEGNFNTTVSGNYYNNTQINCNFRITRQQ